MAANAEFVQSSTEPVTSIQRVAFTLALAGGSRAMFVRDGLLGRIRRPKPQPGVELTPLFITSGRNRLGALFCAPTNVPVRSAVLICHGIGEVVVQWARIQQMLAAHGIASLAFDYSGYGRSTGWPTPVQLEQDALSAYDRLRALTPAPISLLGFSLGTGIATAILDRVEARSLVLCAGFTSFRAATRCVGFPRPLLRFAPPVWDAEPALRSVSHPVLVVHSAHDQLFPLTMAKSLASWSGLRAQLHIVRGLHHNEPFYKPTAAYWDPIADFLVNGNPRSSQPV